MKKFVPRMAKMRKKTKSSTHTFATAGRLRSSAFTTCWRAVREPLHVGHRREAAQQGVPAPAAGRGAVRTNCSLSVI